MKDWILKYRRIENVPEMITPSTEQEIYNKLPTQLRLGDADLQRIQDLVHSAISSAGPIADFIAENEVLAPMKEDQAAMALQLEAIIQGFKQVSENLFDLLAILPTISVMIKDRRLNYVRPFVKPEYAREFDRRLEKAPKELNQDYLMGGVVDDMVKTVDERQKLANKFMKRPASESTASPQPGKQRKTQPQKQTPAPQQGAFGHNHYHYQYRPRYPAQQSQQQMRPRYPYAQRPRYPGWYQQQPQQPYPPQVPQQPQQPRGRGFPKKQANNQQAM